MINSDLFKQGIKQSNIAPWQDFLLNAVDARYQKYTHGEIQQWQQLLDNLPELALDNFDLSKGVSLNSTQTLSDNEKITFSKQLMQLHPWRKGPFDIFSVNINTEWRSDWKWERIIPHISSLNNRTVLDVGCGNGYHCWRMLGENARFVLGIDPSQKYLAQFNLLQHYLQQSACQLLPLGVEDMPQEMVNDGFDSVFCMGVLYHQKSPIQLINHLKNLLNRGGELILETLVVDGDEQTVLVPSSRYAQMRNVWFLPSVKALELWLKKCGFCQITTVDINQTTVEEQRTTEWMTFHSLVNFLDPNDPNKTVEGYSAPKRATIIATKP
jgi:tRNA (mo5U34)-methyltransferase